MIGVAFNKKYALPYDFVGPAYDDWAPAQEVLRTILWPEPVSGASKRKLGNDE